MKRLRQVDFGNESSGFPARYFLGPVFGDVKNFPDLSMRFAGTLAPFDQCEVFGILRSSDIDFPGRLKPVCFAEMEQPVRAFPNISCDALKGRKMPRSL